MVERKGPPAWRIALSSPREGANTMVDVDTFLTTLSVRGDDFCKTSLPLERHPGPQAPLSRSEVVTLALCGQWQGFGSERGLYRYAQRHLRAAFPSGSVIKIVNLCFDVVPPRADNPALCHR